jgi:hypothetical protein
MSKVDLYAELHRELIEAGVLPADSPHPSNRYHGHVTTKDGWVRDEPLAV